MDPGPQACESGLANIHTNKEYDKGGWEGGVDRWAGEGSFCLVGIVFRYVSLMTEWDGSYMKYIISYIDNKTSCE